MITTTITARERLTEPDIRAMFALHRRYFAGTCNERFRHDLAEKDWVITLHDTAALAGFSTQKLITLADRPEVRFLFSGDTIVDRPYWNQPGLAGGWGHLAMKLAAEREGCGNLYWFLICKGFRTYRFLPTFFRHYYPRPGNADDAVAFNPILDTVAAARYGSAYNPARGVIRSSGTGDRLADGWTDIAPHHATDPHIAYFLAANPGWRDGDELACLAPFTRDNLNPLGHRVIRTTGVAWNVD